MTEQSTVRTVLVALALTCLCARAAAAIFGAKNGDESDTEVSLVCRYNESLETRPAVNQTLVFPKTLIVHCKPPIDSYTVALRALKLNTSDLNTLRLEISDTNQNQLNFSHFTGLSIEDLQIANSFGRILLDSNVLETPSKLSLWRVKLVDLNTSRSDCLKLECLYLWECELPKTTMGRGLLAHCSRLWEIQLEMMTLDTARRALAGVRTLMSLSITRCQLDHIPEGLFDDLELRKLDLSHNSLVSINGFALKSQSLLQELNLSNNRLQNLNVLWNEFVFLKELRRLSVDNNTELNMCVRMGDDNVVVPLLEVFSMRGTSVPHCLSLWNEAARAERNINDFEPFMLKRNVTVLVDWSLDCDCQYGWIARELASRPHFKLSGARCISGEEFVAEPLGKLACDKYQCAGCTCRRTWVDQSIRVDCRDARQRVLPRVPGAVALLANGSLIDTLHAEDFPQQLLLVDLNENRISRVGENVTAAMFANAERRVRLAGNPLLCDCDNRPLLEMLRLHRMQVEDYGNITCVADGRALDEVVVDELCVDQQSRTVWLVTAILGTSVVALCVLASLCYRYKRQIKVFLFVRGCCMFCLLDEKIEPDCEFDAFLSFCHQDDEFVYENIIPELEGYKLCIHYRDWVAGEFISAQIARSIEKSRRTIIVLTRNFVGSTWGMYEFRVAHASIMEKGRPRLIVVMVDDVLEDPCLDAELRSYLAANLYIRWGDRFFWNKLWYELPHRLCTSEAEDVADLDLESIGGSEPQWNERHRTTTE